MAVCQKRMACAASCCFFAFESEQSHNLRLIVRVTLDRQRNMLESR